MTIINRPELDRFDYLDQCLMWAIVSINAANLNPKNPFVNDNAAIRSESKDFIQWSVTQDDKGEGRFVYNALLPVENNHPLKHKESIIQTVLSYSPFEQNLETEIDIDGYGWSKPIIPNWINTTEQLLSYLAIIATKISKYARLTRGDLAFWSNVKTKYWGECQYSLSDTPYGGNIIITGYLTIDWNKYIQGRSLIECLNPYSDHASDISCNFPDLMQLWAVGDIDLDDSPESVFTLIPSTGFLISGQESAESLIDSYGDNYFLDEAVPDWYLDAINGYSDRSDSGTNTNVDIGSTTPKIIESLTVCKEQDPNIANFAINLADKIQT
jgi:hypothetical protein